MAGGRLGVAAVAGGGDDHRADTRLGVGAPAAGGARTAGAGHDRVVDPAMARGLVVAASSAWAAGRGARVRRCEVTPDCAVPAD